MINERDLYRLYHRGLDIEPPVAAFQRLKIELDKSTPADQQRRGERTLMTRNRLALLAATLVVVLTGAVLVGPQVYSRVVSRPIPASHGPTYKEELAALLARPLTVHTIGATETCPTGPNTQSLLGAGPIYGIGGFYNDSAWGTYWDVSAITPHGLPGPIVIRGLDVRLGWPQVFLSKYGVGDPYGTDTFQGKVQTQYTAIALDASHPPAYTYPFLGRTYFLWGWQQGFKHGWSGCVGYQIDGPSFTEIFYADVQGPNGRGALG